MQKSLIAILRIRQLVIRQAKYSLEAALTNQHQNTISLALIEEVAQREIDAATAMTADDSMVEISAAWLSRNHTDLISARQLLTYSESETMRARSILTAATIAEAAATIAEATVQSLIDIRIAKVCIRIKQQLQIAQSEIDLNRCYHIDHDKSAQQS